MESKASTLDSGRAWVVACAALAIMTIAHGAPLVAVVALKPIAADLGTARSAPAAAGALTYVGAAFGGVLAGYLSGLLGIRLIVMFGATMLAAGLMLSSIGNLPTLYVGHGVLMGLLGASCLFSPIMTYVGRWFDRRRAAAVALISSGQSIGGAVWPVIIQVGITGWGWRWTMFVFGLLVFASIVLLSAIFLSPVPEAAPAGWPAQGARPPAAIGGLSPNPLMVLLMLAVFCCCIPMAMPMTHVAAFCGDLGFSPQIGAAMLSVLLGSAFLSRQFWGWLADRIGGLKTLFWSSLAQVLALTGFLLTQDEWRLFAVASAFGLGLSGLLPAYVITVREYFPPVEANWRVPTVLAAGFVGMASGGWGAGVLYDGFGTYLPAFGAGIAFNILNLIVLGALVSRRTGPRPAHAG